ncbi:alkylation response protein AidB-like acyl-CoA dehydrogenase [Sphingomonas aurantiaca]|jgi:alkylation response protein AidB-like acyl-CoA dehydrogenase|uniref:Alkylation response protein AidB-like acyl-CoA dehydrogenase n=1 Tax=Sphingomonas aurantiaca TaxID=185949 RepID=A0A2T5GSZ5_9SPHN|nr:acyl-CoA dehydrogenase [Sphingomonas aurantiaca]PTQ62454.1 alkylation response protein AidB-like acyl-CoA dehydrogenase [Sphingomonas aurantiaca]
MNFDHTDDRRMLADTLVRALRDGYPIDTRNAGAYSDVGYDPAVWQQLTELGIVSALFDEAAGGFGGSGFDIMVVFEALGRALVVEPFLGALMAGRALAAAGGHDETLAGIVSGETIAAFAQEDGATPVTATKSGDGWTLSGTKAVVAQAGAASVFVVVIEQDEPLVFLVPADTAGVSVRSYNVVEGGGAGDVTFDGVTLGADARVGGEGQGQAIVDAAVGAGLLALSAEAVGAMEFVKEATLGYLRDRKQFGVPIGKFQALQHRMATVLLEIEQAQSAVINAASAFDGDDAKARARALAAAKYTIGRTGALVAEESIQLHGGIGMTWEYAVSHYAKRLVMIDHQLGDEDHHLQRYIALG